MNQEGHSLTRSFLLVNHCAVYGSVCCFRASNAACFHYLLQAVNPWKPSELALDGMFLKTSIAVPVPGEEPREKVLVVRCARYFGLTALLSGI